MSPLFHWLLACTLAWPEPPSADSTARPKGSADVHATNTARTAPGGPVAIELPEPSTEDLASIERLPPRGRVRWLGPMGATGIVVGTTGLAAVALGLVFLRKGTTTEPDPANDTLVLVKDYSRPGWALTGVGMGAYAVGAIALAIDVTVGRERRLRRAVIRPQLGLDHAGLQLRYRF